MKKIIAVLLFAVMLFALAACGAEKNDVSQAMEIDYNEVIREYDANPARAEEKYEGKIVKLTEKVAGFDVFGDSIYFGDSLSPRVDVYLPKETTAKLDKGQEITVVGRVKECFIDILTIKDAILVE